MAEAAVAGRTQGKLVAGAIKVPGKINTGFPVLTQAMTLSAGSDGVGEAGTYTGQISIPAGAYILDVQVHGIVLWTAEGTSASLIVGDAANDDGWYEATDLKATDLLAGESLTFEHPGGKAGAFIASEQRKLYYSAASVLDAVITTQGTAGLLGRTRIVVFYTIPTAVEATYSAT